MSGYENNHRMQVGLLPNIFRFMAYSDFIFSQSFSHKSKDLTLYFLQIYSKLINHFAPPPPANNRLSYQYIVDKHIQNIDTEQIKVAVKNIKKHWIFGNKIEYRFLLLAQVLHALKLLEISLDDSQISIVKDILQFSDKSFSKAMEYALDHSNITDQKIAHTFQLYNDFIESQNIYYKTSIKNIGICANMSAGKSSFINALLGQDLLLARNTATTECITSIYDYDHAKNVYGIRVRENEIIDISDDIHNSILDSWNTVGSHIILQANIDNISNKHCIVALHDTPGVNNSTDDNHHKITMDFFASHTMDIIIYIANLEHLCTTDEKVLLESIQKYILNKKRSNILFVLNKCDCIDRDKESLDDMLENYKIFLENIGFKEPKIYPLSSKAARLFKMTINNHVDLLSENEKDNFIPLLNRFHKRVILDKDPIDFKLDSDETIEIDSYKIEKSKLYLALKNTGMLKLEKDIDCILARHSS